MHFILNKNVSFQFKAVTRLFVIISNNEIKQYKKHIILQMSLAKPRDVYIKIISLKENDVEVHSDLPSIILIIACYSQCTLVVQKVH
jgi:hypothetical protein